MAIGVLESGRRGVLSTFFSSTIKSFHKFCNSMSHILSILSLQRGEHSEVQNDICIQVLQKHFEQAERRRSSNTKLTFPQDAYANSFQCVTDWNKTCIFMSSNNYICNHVVVDSRY